MAKNKEIRDILSQINIETSCYDSVQSPALWLVVAHSIQLYIPQANKWKTIELALLNAGMAGAGAWGYVALMDSDVAKGLTQSLSLAMLLEVKLWANISMMGSSSHSGGEVQ